MTNTFTAFEMMESECRVLQIKQLKTGLKIEKFFAVPFPSKSGTDAALHQKAKTDALRAAIKERSLEIGESILILPKQYVTVRHVSLPSVDNIEIAQMARFEAEKHIPFNVERHNISHHIMKKEGVSGSHVLIAAADSPVVDEPLAILSALGIQPAVATVSTVSLYNIFRHLNPAFPEEATVALLHIGMINIDLVIINKGFLVFTRSTSHGVSKLFQEMNEQPNRTKPLGLEDIKNIDLMKLEQPMQTNGETGGSPALADFSENDIALIEQWKNKLLQSIRQTHDFARREFECPMMERIFISGEAAAFPSIEEYMTSALGIAAEKINAAGHPIEGIAQLPSAYLPCLGALIELTNHNAIRLNLLPERYIVERLSRQKRQNILSLSLMIGGVLILSILYLQAYTMRQDRLTEWYNKQNEKLKPEVARLMDMQKKTRIISDYVRDPRNALAILDYISTFPYMPRSVSVMEFKYTKGSMVEISGHALDIKDLNLFIGDLEKSGFFSDVKIKQRPWIPLSGNRPKVLNYTLTCAFEGEKK
ncbi:MAG TPA: pilus assembly protein PilM [Candidatus Sumerlaeota bacterium]|nr:pilus assembly protein PilM [Candidatus Sumerlaeota bacterium]HON49816.1 pilus assembly protein PilM [Candidatus Sumerlaeota bacterium]HOR63936.1 pilus assembly protein PilM [Candidatus Sumerlaeota bacterium]HPL75084.1 pilus assembly protein PilM [Candidatus Sumerlaeota bacterium]HRU53699.1 pilus assembly protein PilM [Candidatus Sumerlaeia bacterium]